MSGSTACPPSKRRIRRYSLTVHHVVHHLFDTRRQTTTRTPEPKIQETHVSSRYSSLLYLLYESICFSREAGEGVMLPMIRRLCFFFLFFAVVPFSSFWICDASAFLCSSRTRYCTTIAHIGHDAKLYTNAERPWPTGYINKHVRTGFSARKDDGRDDDGLPFLVVAIPTVALLSLWPLLAFFCDTNEPTSGFDIDMFMALKGILSSNNDFVVNDDGIVELPPLSPAEQLVGTIFGPP